jgi:site-specific DNA-cytosine methylase
VSHVKLLKSTFSQTLCRHTAYGSLAPVPGNVDLLIAGTSCVDYSNLNNEKKDIDAGGESGRTFHGMMTWILKHRPPIIILENVCSAPWTAICKKFESVGYSAEWHRLDTKQYYIPHTRTRGYLLAVDIKNSSIPKKWVQRMTEMRREASVSLDALLLESDDPRVHRAREKLVQESYNSDARKTGQTDWGRCESRHHRSRLEEQLGQKRPLTQWGEG